MADVMDDSQLLKSMQMPTIYVSEATQAVKAITR